MIYTQKLTNDITISSLEDLKKLPPFLEKSILKVNKSQIARELGKDRRTMDKYLNVMKNPQGQKISKAYCKQNPHML